MSKSPVDYTVALLFERFEYNIDNISSFCSTPSGGQCTEDIPYGTGSQQALVVTTIPDSMDWTENVDIKTNYIISRQSGYVILLSWYNESKSIKQHYE